ncbi:MAG: flavin reductase family protein [Halieaceae bacterium]|jgi:flavin reductase (DIM6/NTAB) family NADH-FMN oxidoreductase RutF|nr:flavin reductase family protein [Halieaceae bacterium]
MSFSSLDLRNALGRFTTGVCLVTVTDPAGQAHAVTVNSFASVSLDPPLVLWSIQKDSDVYRLFAEAPQFAIGVLSSAQEAHSTRYSQKDGHALDPAHFTLGENGAPLIREALVNFECSLERSMEGGDHTILLGRVTRLVAAEAESLPLLFFGGNYRELR